MRQQHRDAALVMRLLEDFNQRQSELLFAVARALVSYEPPPFQSVTDADIADAVSALAATSETAGRGVIYEHRPSSGPAAHLAVALKAQLTEAGAYRDSTTERDLVLALRRLEATFADMRPTQSVPDTSAFRAFLRRIFATPRADERPSRQEDRASRLIVS